MTAPNPMATPSVEGTHLLLYDGVCGMCSALLQFVLARDRRAVFVFAPLQGDLGRETVRHHGGDPDALSTFYVVANYRTPAAAVLTRSRAALFVAGELGWPWKAATALRLLPTVLLDVFYDLVARYRYRVFGQLDQCLLQTPQHKKRFVG